MHSVSRTISKPFSIYFTIYPLKHTSSTKFFRLIFEKLEYKILKKRISNIVLILDKYQAPFRFTGLIKHVTIDTFGELFEDDEAKMRVLMAQQ